MSHHYYYIQGLCWSEKLIPTLDLLLQALEKKKKNHFKTYFNIDNDCRNSEPTFYYPCSGCVSARTRTTTTTHHHHPPPPPPHHHHHYHHHHHTTTTTTTTNTTLILQN
jgi:hypothetical protein